MVQNVTTRVRVLLRFLILLPVLGGLVLAVTLSRQRAFQVDEVEHIHVTYNIEAGRQIYKDFWEAHNPLIYALLRPLVDPADAVGSFRRARWLPLFALLATVLLTGYAAYRLAGEVAGWLGGGLVMTHSTMVERGIEVRPDGLLALAVAGALAIELSPLPMRRRFAMCALVLGLGFVATQKAAFICLGFAAWWAWHAWRERRIGLIALPAACGLAPFVVQLLAFAQQGVLQGYLQGGVLDSLRRVDRTLTGSQFGPIPYLIREAAHNPVFSLLAALALLLSAWSLFGKRPAAPQVLVTLLAWLSLATLWLNPFPFPYLHVTVIPVLAVLTAQQTLVLVGPRSESAGRRRLLVAALVLVAASATSLPRIATRLGNAQGPQLSVLSEVQSVTTPDDTVFDLAGLYFRRDAYPVFVMTGAMMTRYYRGDFPPIIPYLERNQPAVMMLNYRTRALPRRDQLFLRAHYVHLDGPIFVLGASLRNLRPSESMAFELLKTDAYRYQGPPGILVDGSAFEAGELRAGRHTLTATSEIEAARILLDRAARHQTAARSIFEIYPAFD